MKQGAIKKEIQEILSKHNIDLSFQTPQKQDVIDEFLDRILLNDINYGPNDFQKPETADVGVQTINDDSVVQKIEQTMKK